MTTTQGWALVIVGVIVILFVFFVTRREMGKQNTNSSKAALPTSDAQPKYPRTIPRKVAAGTRFPMNDVRPDRRSDSGDDGFVLSAAATAATGNPVLGAVIGGNIAGAVVGHMLTNNDDDRKPATESPPSADTSSNDSGGDGGGD